MSRCSRIVLFAGWSMVCCGVSASAETLRCRSVNGNLNCAGSDGVSCQTVNGKTVCVSGHGDVVQSFGNGPPSDPSGDDTDDAGSRGRGDVPPGPAVKERLERYDARGRTLLLDRDGTRLHLRTDWLSIDRE